MTPQQALSYFANAGHTVAEGAGAGWYDVGSRFFMAVPFDQPVDVRLVQNGGFLPRSALGARFVCLADQGRPAWAIRCAGPNYDIERLGSNVRSKVRRGLARFVCAPFPACRLEREGERLNKETLERQGRLYSAAAKASWRRMCRALELAIDADIWGAEANGELAAYLIALRIGNVSHLLILRSGAAHLKNYVNNALLFSYLRNTLEIDKLDYVSFGLEPLGRDLPDLVRFKESMGFERVSIRQAVVLTPGLDKLLRSPAGQLAAPASRLLPKHERLKRLASLASYVRKQERLVFAEIKHVGA
jgi:hypothetical protein